MKTETPRTDAIVEATYWEDGNPATVQADFARKLERELNASKNMTRRLAEALANLHGECMKEIPEYEAPDDVLNALEEYAEVAAAVSNDGTQRPGDAEATNATRATPPGSLK